MAVAESAQREADAKAQVAQSEAEIKRLQNECDNVRTQLEDFRKEHSEALKRCVKAENELHTVQHEMKLREKQFDEM